MKYLLNIVFVFITCLIYLSYATKADNKKGDDIRVDIRFGKKFYSLLINGDCSRAIKGNSTLDDTILIIYNSDTSAFFKMDSLTQLKKEINKLNLSPIFNNRHSDAPRIEIYSNRKKIYDIRFWDSLTWSILNPIMYQLPKAYNPFVEGAF